MAKEKVVNVTEENMFALVNEISDLKQRSFYNQRLLKVPQESLKRSSLGRGTPEQASTKVGSSFQVQPYKQRYEELNEGIILKSLDQKKTYFNSILSKIKPKFKYKKRFQANMVDEDGNSLREDIDSSLVGPDQYSSRTNGRSHRRGIPLHSTTKDKKNLTHSKVSDQNQRIKKVIADIFNERNNA